MGKAKVPEVWMLYGDIKNTTEERKKEQARLVELERQKQLKENATDANASPSRKRRGFDDVISAQFENWGDKFSNSSIGKTLTETEERLKEATIGKMKKKLA